MDKCYAFLNNTINKQTAETSKRLGLALGCGYANGYVAIPPSHPFHSKGYAELPEEAVSIHGGLTFAESMKNIKGSWGKDVECVDFKSLDEIPDDYWVFGFDTMHCNDGPHRTREWCLAEVDSLKKHLVASESYADPSLESSKESVDERIVQLITKVLAGCYLGELRTLSDEDFTECLKYLKRRGADIALMQKSWYVEGYEDCKSGKEPQFFIEGLEFKERK